MTDHIKELCKDVLIIGTGNKRTIRSGSPLHSQGYIDYYFKWKGDIGETITIILSKEKQDKINSYDIVSISYSYDFKEIMGYSECDRQTNHNKVNSYSIYAELADIANTVDNLESKLDEALTKIECESNDDSNCPNPKCWVHRAKESTEDSLTKSIRMLNNICNNIEDLLFAQLFLNEYHPLEEYIIKLKKEYNDAKRYLSTL